LQTFRLLAQQDYRQIAIEGKKVYAGNLFLKWIDSPDGVCRFCFVVKKRNGNAVFRNRCRRILRPLFFAQSEFAPKALWCMIFVGENEKTFDRLRLHSDASKAFERLGWLAPHNPPHETSPSE